jgi:hypothetical protein
MHCISKYILIFILVALGTSVASAQVQISAQVDTRSNIYVGESFTYYIIIDGDNRPGDVDLTPLLKYNPQNPAKQDVSQTSVSFINGRTTQNVTKRLVMSYTLTVNQAGRITLPPVTITLDGKTYKTNPVQVNILEPGTTNQLDLEVSLSEQKCYAGQPVIMTVNFYVSANIGDFQFNVPAFTDDTFYIEEPDITNPQAKNYNLGNGITVGVIQTRTTHNGKESILLSFSKVLIPKKSGEIEIAPASVSADVATGRARSQGNPFDDVFFDSFLSSQQQYQRFMVKSQPLKLSVLPLPNINKPAGFYGLVGKYTISATATPTKVNVGDPITLDIRIGGNKYLKPVQWPELEQIPELANNFKIPSQKASPTIQNDSKVFTQTIRASNDQIKEIPSIPLVFFDPQNGEYITAKTEPIKLEVSPSKVLTNVDIEGVEHTPAGKEIEAISKGLSANYEGLDALENQTFSPLAAIVQPGYLVIWSGPMLLLILSAAVKLVTHNSPEKTTRRRQRAAAGKAAKELGRIVCSARGQHEHLASIMKQYIGERFDRTAGALTSNDCYEIVHQASNDIQIANRYKAIIAVCDAARYTSAESGIDQKQIKEVIDLIKTIDKKSGK